MPVLLLRHDSGELRGKGGRGPIRRVLVLARERDCHGRDAEHRRFARPRDRTGVGDVVRHVGAAIDAGDDEIRGLGEKLPHREGHAVGRGSRHREHALADVLEAKRLVDGERVAHRAHLFRGSDDGDDANLRELRRERTNSRGRDPVVIGHENVEYDGLLPLRPPGPSSFEFPGSRERQDSQTPRKETEWEWSGRPDLNRRPLAPQASALPGCATSRSHSIRGAILLARDGSCKG